VRVTLLLADSAQIADGKLYVLGGGWSFTGPVGPMAIAALIAVPWDATTAAHHFRFELLDADGNAALVDGVQAVTVDGDFDAGRPIGHPEGAPVTVPLAINLPPLPLGAGQRYEWRLIIDGETAEGWTLPFNVRPATEPTESPGD
jgi:hypothetical protein